MRLIDIDLLKQVFERNVVGTKAYRVLFDNAPTVPAIPMERIKQLREEMDDTMEFICKRAESEEQQVFSLSATVLIMKLIDNMIKEYEP